MQFTLFHLTYELARRLGLTTAGVATGGNTTTLIDTVSRNEPDDFWNGGTAWLLYDAGGAAAAPEADYRTISDFTNSSSTVAVSAAWSSSSSAAAGDRYALATKLVPIGNLIELLNEALRDLGPIPTVDKATITTAAAQTEHSLPVAANLDLRRVWFQNETSDANDNQWTEIYNWWVERTATGTADLLHTEYQYTSGSLLMLEYMAHHATLNVTTDKLNESIPLERVIYPATLAGFYYLRRRYKTGDYDADIERWERMVADVKANFPIKRAPQRPGRLMMVGNVDYIVEDEPNKVRLS